MHAFPRVCDGKGSGIELSLFPFRFGALGTRGKLQLSLLVIHAQLPAGILKYLGLMGIY